MSDDKLSRPVISVMKRVLIERRRQDEKWGADQRNPQDRWLAILVEEIGEVAKEMLNGDPRFEQELVEVAAVAVAWLEQLHKDKETDGPTGV